MFTNINYLKIYFKYVKMYFKYAKQEYFIIELLTQMKKVINPTFKHFYKANPVLMRD